MPIHPVFNTLSRLFVRKELAKPAPPKPGADSHPIVLEVLKEFGSITESEAWDVVEPFSRRLESGAFLNCSVLTDSRVVSDTGYYSQKNLTCTRAKTLTAFKVIYVRHPDDEAAWAASHTLTTRVASVLPDGEREPIDIVDLERLNRQRDQLLDRMKLEWPILMTMRSRSYGPVKRPPYS